MQPRAPYARLGHRKIIVGLTILVAIGLVSVYKYYSRQEWGGELQQSTALEHGASELADQNRLMEQIYQESQAVQNEQLEKLEPRHFEDVVFKRDDRDASWRVKYIWDFFLPFYNCPLREKIGVDRELGDNGKWLCGVRTYLQREGCIVYSFGSNGETTFEQDILAKSKCEVHVFDPTLTQDVQERVSSIEGVTFHNYGLGVADGEVNLTDPRESMGKGFSSFRVKSLDTIMRELEHPWIDVLKIDIEGFEWPVLRGMIDNGKRFPFTQMQVEYHHFNGVNITTPREMLDVLKGLEQKNLRVFSVEPNYWWDNNGYDFIEYAYLQVGKDGGVVTGPAKKSGKLRIMEAPKLAAVTSSSRVRSAAMRMLQSLRRSRRMLSL